MADLAALGVRIVLDEFGTGLTSLDVLPDLPLHAVKLDATLATRMLDETDGMVTGVVGLARELDLEVEVPRIEERAQLLRARQLRCDRAQGYLIGHPVPAAEVWAAASAG